MQNEAGSNMCRCAKMGRAKIIEKLHFALIFTDKFRDKNATSKRIVYYLYNFKHSSAKKMKISKLS